MLEHLSNTTTRESGEYLEDLDRALVTVPLRACQNRQEIKALLIRRQEQWKQNFRRSLQC